MYDIIWNKLYKIPCWNKKEFYEMKKVFYEIKDSFLFNLNKQTPFNWNKQTLLPSASLEGKERFWHGSPPPIENRRETEYKVIDWKIVSLEPP